LRRNHFLKLLTDPYNAKKLADELVEVHGLPFEYTRQGYLSLSDPTKTLHELIIAGKIRHGGNPILRWHASIAVARRDAAGNIKLDKEKSRRKIDGMAALVNAIGAAILHPPEPPSIYEKRGMLWL
jgi:phage terminase large subunit-like protein